MDLDDANHCFMKITKDDRKAIRDALAKRLGYGRHKLEVASRYPTEQEFAWLDKRTNLFWFIYPPAETPEQIATKMQRVLTGQPWNAENDLSHTVALDSLSHVEDHTEGVLIEIWAYWRGDLTDVYDVYISPDKQTIQVA